MLNVGIRWEGGGGGEAIFLHMQFFSAQRWAEFFLARIKLQDIHLYPVLTIVSDRQINFTDGTFRSIGQLLFTVGQYFTDGEMSCNAGSA